MPIDATLTKRDKNTVLEMICQYQFDPADFFWEVLVRAEFQPNFQEFTVSHLVHRRSQYYFTFGGRSLVFSPGVAQKVEEISHGHSWNSKGKELDGWLSRVREEVDAPDLWASVGQERELANAASSEDTDNNPLNPREKQLVSESLKEIKSTLLSMQQFNQRQAAIVDGQFKYLGEAVSRMGKKDWLNLTFSNLVTVIVGLSLTQAQGSALLKLAASLLHSLWDGMLTLGH